MDGRRILTSDTTRSAALVPGASPKTNGATTLEGVAGAVGNRAFTRALGRASLPARSQEGVDELAPPTSTQCVSQALAQRDPARLRGCPSFDGVDDALRGQLIDLMLSDPATATSPTLHRLWRWPRLLEILSSGDPSWTGRWARSVDGSPSLRVAVLDEVERRFAADVRALAGGALDRNAVMIDEERERIAGSAGTARRERIVMWARQASQLMHARDACLRAVVGENLEVGQTPGPQRVAATFDPDRPPDFPETSGPGWEALHHTYVTLIDELAVVGARSPVIHAGIASGSMEGLAGDAVGERSRALLERASAAVADAREALGSGGLDWGELTPIHARLLSGEHPGGVNWAESLMRSLVEAMLLRRATKRIARDVGMGLGMGLLTAGAAVMSTGAAVPFAAGAASVGVGVVETRRAAMRMNAVGAAEHASVGAGHLVPDGAAAEATTEAILDAAFTLLGGLGLADMGRRTVREARHVLRTQPDYGTVKRPYRLRSERETAGGAEIPGAQALARWLKETRRRPQGATAGSARKAALEKARRILRNGPPGPEGVPVRRRLTRREMWTLTEAYEVEFALVYVLGPGRAGGGGQYVLLSGSAGRVEVPIGPLYRIIYHTHPYELEAQEFNFFNLYASSTDIDLMRMLARTGSPQRASEVIVSGDDVRRFGVRRPLPETGPGSFGPVSTGGVQLGQGAEIGDALPVDVPEHVGDETDRGTGPVPN